MAKYSQKWHNGTSRSRSTKTSDRLAAIQAQLNNLGREIKKVIEKVYAAQEGDIEQQLRDSIKGTINRASTDAAIRNQGASIKSLEIQIGQMSKVLQERGFGSLPSSTEMNPRDQVKSISTPIEVDSYPIRQAYSKASQSIPQKEKDPGSFTLPCFINNVCVDNALVDLGASVSGMPLSTCLNLGLGELSHTKLTIELADRTMKYPKGIAENIPVGIGKFTFPIDFIILDMPEDIKVPLILERPFLSTTCAKIDVYKRKITLRVGEERIVFTSVKPTSSLIKRVYMLSLRERMELNLEARLMVETLVLNRLLDPFLEDYIELNDLNEPFELRRNQGDNLMPTIEEGDVIEEFRTRDDELIVGIDDYPILENMDAYRDEGMGDVIFGDPFLREVGIKTGRFEGMITIYKGDDEQDPTITEGSDYMRDAKIEEWLTRGHIKPKNVNEALTDDSWIVAMQEELNQFIANDVWELVPQPRNMTIIGTKWVFRNKLDENGIVSQNKARLVAQGYIQQEGIDYDETYTPVARLESIRILLAYARALDFKLLQMDVKSAFLNGFINEEVYVA
ncbi:mitochondrial proton/calcium exchanger protein-like protein isoform X1 [Tanacetum coccineum]